MARERTRTSLIRARMPGVRNATTPAVFEGGAQTRRTSKWYAPTVSPNDAILGNLVTLRDRSRGATRNNGYAKGAIDHLVTNIIGTGIKPLSQIDATLLVPHPHTGELVPLRRLVQELWALWTDESDADGLLDWYGQQAQAVRAWLEGGEVFARLRPRFATDGLSVPLQVQIIEPELCPHTYNATLPSGNRVRAGIEFNGIGKRVAYWMYPSRSGDLVDYDASQLRRIPAETVVHLYDPTRPGQLRGLPHLTQALIALFETDKMNDAVVLRQQLGNMFVAFLRRPSPTDGTDPPADMLTGLTPDTDGDNKPMLSLEPGIFQELAPGEEVDFSKPPDPSPAFGDFVRQQMYHISAATGVPYETLTGDLSRVNDRTVRVILHEFRRRVSMWQHQIVAFQLCRPLYTAWLDRAFLAGTLPLFADYATNRARYAAVKWMPQGWPYINPVQDIEAKKAEIRAGLGSRSDAVSEQGEDVEVIDQQQADDNARADRLGLKYDSDGRQPANGPKAAADPIEPDPNPSPIPN